MKIFRNGKRKGAITIFLTIILIPTMLFSAILIDGSRLASAKAMTQEAADLAAISAIADYNLDLKEEFGLFAIDDPDSLETLYETSLKETLMAEGFDSQTEYSDYVTELLIPAMLGEKSYMDADFLNLYDFQIDSLEVEPLFSLAEKDVLETQMIEYAKYRGLFVLMDRLTLLQNLDGLGELMKEQLEAAGAMKEKMGIDQQNAAADQAVADLKNAIERFKSALGNIETDRSEYIESLEAYMEDIRISNTDTEDELDDDEEKALDKYSKRRNALIKTYEQLAKEVKNISELAETVSKESDAAVKRLKDFASEHGSNSTGSESSDSASAITQMADEATNGVKDYQEYYDAVQPICNNEKLNGLASSANTGAMKNLIGSDGDIEEAIDKGIEVIEAMIAEWEEEQEEAEESQSEGNTEEEEEEQPEITDYYFFYLNSEEYTESIHEVLYGSDANSEYEPAVKALYEEYKSLESLSLDLKEDENVSGSTAINKDDLKSGSGSGGNADEEAEGSAARGEIDKDYFDQLPSKKDSSASTEESSTTKTYDLYNENDEGDLTGVQNILGEGTEEDSIGQKIQNLGETMRDDMLDMSYIFGTFKTRLTGTEKLTGNGMSEKVKASEFMPEWRKDNPEGEQDLRFEPKKDRETVLRSEIEYIIYGMRTDAANEAAAYAAIYALRYPNNIITLYLDSQINKECHAAATAAAAASAAFGIIIPEQVYFWLFLAVWAGQETAMDMKHMIVGGYEIPFIKTKEEIVLTDVPFTTNSVDVSVEKYKTTSGLGCPIRVTYEDYLLLLLLITGDEHRIMRTADLVEMNMRKNGEDEFSMSEAYTYMKADTQMSIRYMFGNVMPFSSTYEEKGLTSRIKYNNSIYLGY